MTAETPTGPVYPSFRYHATLPPRIVYSQAEHDALDGGWADTPAAFAGPAPSCAGPIVTFDDGMHFRCQTCHEEMSSASPEKVRRLHANTPTENRTPEKQAWEQQQQPQQRPAERAASASPAEPATPPSTEAVAPVQPEPATPATPIDDARGGFRKGK